MTRLYLLVLFGLIIRLVFIQIPGFKVDVDAWAAWATRSYELGFANFYSDQIWTNYTPGYIYVLYLFGAINKLFGLSMEIFYYLLKLPAILSEIALAILVFKIVKEKTSIKLSLFAAGLIVFNPGFIFNSAVWGQIDGLLTLFMVLSIYYLNKNQLILSSITFAIALLIKPQALFLAPAYILFILKNFNLKNIIRLSIPGIFLAITASLPFFPNKPLTGLVELIIKMANDYNATSLFAYNFWGVVGFWIDDSNNWYNLSYRQWSLIILGLYWVSIIFFYFKKSIDLYTLSALALLSFYFLPTRVHERYLYPAIPFLIILFSFYKSKIILFLTIFLSLLHFVNLYFVYIYYNVLYLKIPIILYLPNLFQIIEENNKTLSLLSTLVFLIINYIILKVEYAKKNS